ncbi:related to MGMT family protein [Rhynchosporium agropyri]|uniref:Related to MGMT family protein n=1 Tax=Rhynchosporium agropyri TaxID=914238 RepID=A0A1E1KX92_9HELO|nr:related to MGMT family protein [Rhynchosporium agropyri]
MARTDEAEAFFHAVYSAIQEIPHGKVTSYGHVARLIGTRHPSGATHQAQVLRSEGVTVNTGSLGELMVDLGEYGWFPRQLPSEAAAGLVYDGSESEGQGSE